MNMKISCRKCGRIHTYEEYFESRFCRNCGTWLNINNIFTELEGYAKEAASRVSSTESEVKRRIANLIRNLDKYLEAFERLCPFNNEQAYLHVQTIRLRRECGSVSASLRNNDFVNHLWRTLISWGVTRGADLLPPKKFREKLLEYENRISILEDQRIDDEDLSVEETAKTLWDLINEVRISTADNPIVSGSKMLHHLLPELMPPIDREYTRPFFMFRSQVFQYNPKIVFLRIWKNFAYIARNTDLERYINRGIWNTSITKVIDNAIIGYCKYHKIPKLK